MMSSDIIIKQVTVLKSRTYLRQYPKINPTLSITTSKTLKQINEEKPCIRV